MLYTHDLAKRTSYLLRDFSLNVFRLTTLSYGDSCELSLSYDDSSHHVSLTNISLVARRDVSGLFFLNNIEVGTLNSAMNVVSAICADLIKLAAADEAREDYFEEMAAGNGSIELDHSLIMNDSFQVDPSSMAYDEEIIEVYAADSQALSTKDQ